VESVLTKDLRTETDYAQVRVGSHKTRVRLEHAETVPQAVTELQALKTRRRTGKLTMPQNAPAHNGAQGGEQKPGSPRSKRPLPGISETALSEFDRLSMAPGAEGLEPTNRKTREGETCLNCLNRPA